MKLTKCRCVTKTMISTIAGLFLAFVVVLPSTGFCLELVLVIRPDGEGFVHAVKGMASELESDFVVRELIINKATPVKNIDSAMKVCLPAVAILMDNVSINLYKQYQKTLPDSTKMYTPSISLMGIFIDQAIRELKNASGIVYEVPIVTSAVNLRSILGVPIKKIGVVHRQFMQSMIVANSGFCTKEGIELVARIIPDNALGNGAQLKKELETLFAKDNVDAIWIPNDNILLKSNLVKDVWQPVVARHKKPVIVGLEALANPQLGLGTFAVSPDHDALGGQVGSLILTIKENNWQSAADKISQPLSVFKTINLKQAKEFFNVSDERLQNVDRILK